MRFPLVSRRIVGSLTLAATLASGGFARADETSKRYDVRDLVIQVPDFNDGPTLGVQSEQRAVVADERMKSQDQLTAELGAWLSTALRAEGIDGMKVTAGPNGSLDVSGPDANHGRVQALLEVARADLPMRATMTVTARQVTTAADLATFPPAVRDAMVRATAPSRPSVGVGQAEVDAMFRAVQADRAAGVLTAPRITLFDRQNAYVLVANQRAFVSGVADAVVNGARRSQEQVGVVESGVALEARATADRERKSIGIDLHYQFARLIEMKTESRTAFDGKVVSVQVPVVEKRDVNRTLLLADGGTVLLYLGRAEPSKDEHDSAPAGEAYLLVTATINEPAKKD